MQEYNTQKREKLLPEKPKQNHMTQSFLERETAESANKKLDQMLNKIQQRLSDIKKNKKVETDAPPLSSRSSPKSQPQSPASSTFAVNLSSNSNSIDDFDEMKQIELGLIFQRGSFKANSEQKEYVRDFMNILSDDFAPSEHSKSQEFSQDTASCKAPSHDQPTRTKEDQRPTASSNRAKQQPEADLKYRLHDVISKADTALKNYQRNATNVRSRKSTVVLHQE